MMGQESAKIRLATDALMEAMLTYELEEMEASLRKGADIDNHPLRPDDKQETTPLYVAVVCEDKELLEWVLGKGADIDYFNSLDFLPLADSIENGWRQGTERLLAENPDLSGPAGKKALLAAIEKQDEPLALRLIALGAEWQTDKPVFSESPIHCAASEGLLGVVRALHEKGESLTRPCTRFRAGKEFSIGLMAIAAEANAIEVMEYLLQHDVPTEEHTDISALNYILIGAKTEAMDWLLEHGADPNRSFEGSPLAYTDRYSYFSEFVKLIQYGADLRPYGAPHAIFPHELTSRMREEFTGHLMRVRDEVDDALKEIGAADGNGMALLSKRFFIPAADGMAERPTLTLLQIAGAGMLEALFEREHWQKREPSEAPGLRKRMQAALPGYFRPQVEEIDLNWARTEALTSSFAWETRIRNTPLTSARRG